MLFCYACSRAENDPSLAYALWPEQQSDIDCILRRRLAGDAFAYEAVQLKELPPVETAPSATLERLIGGLAEIYTANQDLRVGIYLNRDIITDLAQLVVPPLEISSLWLFGVGGETGLGGFLVGDCLQPEKIVTEFPFPRLGSSLTEIPRSADA